jgi:Fic family protein
MKLPVPAPTVPTLFEREREHLVQILTTVRSPEVDGKYEHWDKVRHRVAPKPLTSEQWWLGIKLARQNIERVLPIRDKANSPWKVSLTDSMQRRLHVVDKNGAGSIQGMDTKHEAEQQRFLIRSLIEEAMTSSQLEGAATTRAVAKEMLSTGRQPRDQSERMIYNNYVVMNEIRSWGNRPFSPEAIIQIHSMLTEGTMEEEDQCGRLRTDADNVVIYSRESPPTLLHVPPPARELEARLKSLCDFANQPEHSDTSRFLHPVVRAIAIHFQIGYDHPFCDGNGRTARALFYWAMLNSGYWLTEYLSISSVLKKAPSKYIRAYLYTESDSCDLSYFVAQQLEVIEQAIAGFHEYVARKSDENRRAQKLLRSSRILGENINHRQRALLANAIKNPDREYTVASHQTAHRISYPTALHDMTELESMRLLQKTKVGKAFVFFPVRDLPSKLELG